MSSERSTGPTDLRSGRLSATLLGLAVGLIIGIVAAFGGFVDFIIVVLLGAVGTVVGLILDGRIDVTALVDRNRRDR